MNSVSTKRILAAVVVGSFASVATFILGLILAFYVWEAIPEPGPGEEGIFGWNTGFRGSYPFFLAVAFSLTFGFFVSAFIVDPKLSAKTEAFICAVTFACMLGVSSINFAVHDALLSHRKQALIDLFVVLFGSATLINISRWQPTRSISLAARSLMIFVVGAFGILVPLCYMSFYFLHLMGMPIPSDQKDDAWIKLLSALISGIVGFLAYIKGSSEVAKRS